MWITTRKGTIRKHLTWFFHFHTKYIFCSMIYKQCCWFSCSGFTEWLLPCLCTPTIMYFHQARVYHTHGWFPDQKSPGSSRIYLISTTAGPLWEPIHKRLKSRTPFPGNGMATRHPTAFVGHTRPFSSLTSTEVPTSCEFDLPIISLLIPDPHDSCYYSKLLAVILTLTS